MFKTKLIGLALSSLLFSQLRAQVYKIDVHNTSEKQKTVIPMSAKSPKGTVLSVNSQYFEKDGKPWFPIMGEMHYNRVLPQDWEKEIIKMKNGGLSIVATYVFWNEHEIAKGVWDWKGNRDINKFIGLCQKHDMYVWLRIGPWSHGEQLHGGHPDWIQKMKGRRSNDPEYLKESTKLFNQIGVQTNGQYFAQGGPIIGVQLENEYASGQAEHITKLKEIALKAQINPAYWTITANTVFDDKKMEVIPLQGSYPYRGWEKAGGGPTKDFLYGNDQWIMTDALGKVFYDVNMFPKGLCEQGCGSQMMFANRFVVKPEVVEAHLQNQIGRGMNLAGYYMFHGGTQTPGLKEPGLPESYDFQSPISEFGLLRPSYKYLKVLHSFVNDFGSDLAAMQVYEPENPVRDEMDTKNLRYVARAQGNSGFLFLGNTQVRVTMPDKTVSMQVNLANETISFPELTLKGQTTAILPFNLKVGSAVIKYVTAQPFVRLVNGKNITLFFQQLPGVKPQLALTKGTLKTKNFAGWQSQIKSNEVQLTTTNKSDLSFSDTDGNNITLVFLTRKQVENAWRIKLKNQEALLITDADVLAENDKITLQQVGRANFNMQVYPKELNAFTNQKLQLAGHASTLFDTYQQKTQLYVPKVSIKYPEKQRAIISFPSALPSNVNDLILNVDYLGNVCKITQNGKYITDNLYNGTTWQIAMERFSKQSDVELTISDWDNKTTGVPENLVDEIKSKGSMFKSIKAVPQYQMVFMLKN
ncbi:beta-galactosidase [Pedobacter foliorum]|uniref:beta-galactosidase n=1 Tax=Pedobacter foliorum TaxID=2739058 RepID=UPI001566CCF1|nr:beta-galactosidase [Pedobacter foliorum]NRF39555.1 beta-galactosidase [Pedobacter foliorum]